GTASVLSPVVPPPPLTISCSAVPALSRPRQLHFLIGRSPPLSVAEDPNRGGEHRNDWQLLSFVGVFRGDLVSDQSDRMRDEGDDDILHLVLTKDIVLELDQLFLKCVDRTVASDLIETGEA